MSLHQIEKLKRFLSDTVMEGAVHDILLQSFLRPRKETDVQALAASRIAIDLLEEGWRELRKYKNERDTEKETLANPGL